MNHHEVLRPPRGPRRAGFVFAIVSCGALAWSWATCASPSGPGMAPSLIWDGTSFTAAWATDAGSSVGVWSFRWTPGEKGEDARNIANAAELFSPPELMRGDRSYLLALDLGEQGIHVVPLHRTDVEANARPIGEPVRALCRAPVAMGRQFAIAFGVGTGDRVDYHFAILDEDGGVVDRGRLGGGTATHPACTIGYHKGAVGVAYTLDASDGSQLITLAMPGQSFDVGMAEQFTPLRLAGAADGWHLLYGQGDRVGLVHIGRDGRVVGDRMLAADIPARTADFAVGQGGRAVAWSVNRKVWLAPLDDDGVAIGRCGYKRPPSLSPVRLVAAGSGWGMAWTEMDGRTVLIGKITGCAGDAMVIDELAIAGR